MNLIRTIVEHSAMSKTTTIYVLTECALGTRAAYELDWPFNHSSKDYISDVSEHAMERGVKMTERAATEVFGAITNYRR